MKEISFFSRDIIDEYLEHNLEIIHVYGQLGRLEWQTQDYIKECVIRVEEDYGTNKDNLDIETIRKLSKGIKVIGEDKPEDSKGSPHILKAQEKLKEAKNIYILGYGFDKQNSDLLFYEKDKNGHYKHIYENIKTEVFDIKNIFYANLKNSLKVNHQLMNLLEKDNQQSLQNEDYDSLHALNGKLFSITKSTRAIFDALTYDFDLI